MDWPISTPVGTWAGPAQHPYAHPFQALEDNAQERKRREEAGLDGEG